MEVRVLYHGQEYQIETPVDKQGRPVLDLNKVEYLLFDRENPEDKFINSVCGLSKESIKELGL